MNVADYRRVERAIHFLCADRAAPLERVAREAGLSPHHFQRLFSRFAGVSPKKFQQALSLERAREALARAPSVLDAALEAGLSGPGRLHDLVVAHEALTPGELRARGAGLVVRAGFAPSPFGACAVAATGRGVCGLAFVTAGREAALADATRRLERARVVRDDDLAQAVAGRLFGPAQRRGELALVLRGSPFQLRVWEALLRVPEGALVSYSTLARSLGEPRAARAVGGAVAANPIAFLIPCHRVIRESGALGGYRWGEERKRALLAWEAARQPGV